RPFRPRARPPGRRLSWHPPRARSASRGAVRDHAHDVAGRPLGGQPAAEHRGIERVTGSPAVGHRHGSHAHGLVDPSIVRSHAGIRTVAVSLGLLGLTAGIQAVIYVASGSVALLADLIHNAGDALTALPLGIAFFLRSGRAERIGGLAVVVAIFVSACVALYA